jgi:uncharacterized membrane protein YsdA (DUF1294 family)
MTTQYIWWLLIFALAVLNALTWAVYRWDKRQARRGARRISERTLLVLAWVGGWVGALVAVYGHRQRHKAQKLSFMLPLWLAVIVWVGGIAYWVSARDGLVLR